MIFANIFMCWKIGINLFITLSGSINVVYKRQRQPGPGNHTSSRTRNMCYIILIRQECVRGTWLKSYQGS